MIEVAYNGRVFNVVLSDVPEKKNDLVKGKYELPAPAMLRGTVSWGLVFGILSAFMYAFMVIFNKKAASITGLENPMWQLITSFITVAVFLGLKQGFLVHIAPGNLIPILLLGIVNTGIGCYFYFSSIGNLPVQTVAILYYLDFLHFSIRQRF